MASLDGPLNDHMLRLDSGRRPEADDEIVVTPPAMAERPELVDGDGDLLADSAIAFTDGPRVRVTGIAVDPFRLLADARTRPTSPWPWRSKGCRRPSLVAVVVGLGLLAVRRAARRRTLQLLALRRTEAACRRQKAQRAGPAGGR
ncbi:hypothetical protein [Jiangella asiatica]|uniref:Uncharacterized protein n=1 Tax=Jiangella asiatica TaxID=2530372 RepID=A0A4R5D7N0_9ACTN|nr:hypothetical protein [Jiangella asiatica]TDE07900.1 hypothetical protein E1269_19215 [Jiangella asiatica]